MSYPTSMREAYRTDQPAREDVDQFSEPVVLQFGTDWCGHCQAAEPIIEQVFTAYPELKRYKVEDGRGRPLGRSFRVKLWPTVILVHRGQELGRVVRPHSAAQVLEVLGPVAKNLQK